MRNLKRVLSLVLAAMMLMGMMVVGAGAVSTYDSFTDKDEIVNTEAVNTMVSLGVLAGKPGENNTLKYDPTGIVTRGEMAKIIAVTLNGGVDPVLGSSTNVPKFTDVPSSYWAYKYIAYCVQLGIIAGRGDNTFDPDAPVSGSEAAKMFLCALGYRADLEGLVGNDWALKTDILANQDAKLYDKLDHIDPSEGLTRDDTAQMVFNAIQALEVKYENLEGDYSNVLQVVPKNGNTMLNNRFGVVKVTGVVMANDEYALAGYNVQNEGKTYIAPSQLPASLRYGLDGSYNVSVDSSLIGQTVVIYVKGQSTINPNPATAEVLSEAIVSDLNTVATTTKKIAAGDWNSFLRDNGLNTNTIVGIYDNYSTYRNVAVGAGTTANGYEMTFIDNDGDDNMDIVIRLQPVLSKVTSVNTSKEYFNLAGLNKNVDFADAAGYEDFDRGDMVMYLLANGTYHLYDVTTVEGPVSRYRVTNTTDKLYTIDGTEYSESALTNANMSNPTVTADMVTDDTILSGTYKFYLDANNSIIAYEEVEEGEGDYAIVLESGIMSNDALTSDPVGKVKVLLPDGTTATYTLDMDNSAYRYDDLTLGEIKIDKDDVNTFAQVIAQKAQFDATPDNGVANEDGKDAIKDTIVKLTVADDGLATIAPTTMDVAYGNDAAAIAKGAVTYTVPAANISTSNNDVKVTLNNSTKFVFAYGNPNEKYTVITGSNNLPTAGISKDTVYAVAWDKNTQVAEVVFVREEPKTLASDYAYITTKPSGEKDGTTYYYYSDGFTTDGQPITLKFDAPTNFKDTVVRYTVDGKGIASITGGTADTDGTPTNNNAGFEYVRGVVTSLNGNVIGITYGGAEYSFDIADVVAYDISGDDAVETDFAVDQFVVLSTKLVDGNVKIGGAFVLEQVATQYDVLLNGTVVAQAAEGEAVTVDFSDCGFADVAAAADVTVTGTSTRVVKNTDKVSFVMEDEGVVITTSYAVNYTITNTEASLYKDAECTVAANATGTELPYGTTIYVKAAAADQALAITALTNMVPADLVQVTAPADGVYAVYKIVVDGTITFTVGNAI